MFDSLIWQAVFDGGLWEQTYEASCRKYYLRGMLHGFLVTSAVVLLFRSLREPKE